MAQLASWRHARFQSNLKFQVGPECGNADKLKYKDNLKYEEDIQDVAYLKKEGHPISKDDLKNEDSLQNEEYLY